MPISIANLLDSEVTRLNDRKDAIDGAEYERTRIISLTNSAIARQKAYNNIYLVLVIMLIVVVGIKLLYQFELVPSTLLDILITVIISGGLIYSLMMYSDIMRRNNMNFNEIDLGKLPVKTEDQKNADFASGNLAAIVADAQSQLDFNKSGTVPTDASTTTNGVTTYKIKYGNNNPISTKPDRGNLTKEIINNLTNAKNYHTCRKADKTYALMPVTSSNLMLAPNNVLIAVTATDPNFIDSAGTRKAYVLATFSTKPVGEAFSTMETTGIKPFLTNDVYTKYV